MKYTYKPSGVCSMAIELDISDEGIINEVRFVGGCSGNALGISALVKGARISDVIDRLKGIRCGHRNTSCPDQLARALEQVAVHKT